GRAHHEPQEHGLALTPLSAPTPLAAGQVGEVTAATAPMGWGSLASRFSARRPRALWNPFPRTKPGLASGQVKTYFEPCVRGHFGNGPSGLTAPGQTRNVLPRAQHNGNEGRTAVQPENPGLTRAVGSLRGGSRCGSHRSDLTRKASAGKLDAPPRGERLERVE